MATRNTAISVDIEQITELADRVSRLDAEVLTATAVTALNESVDKAYELARERISVGINLSDDYLRRRMTTEHATRSKLEASILASGARTQMTRLASYDAKMVIEPRETTRASRSKGLLPIPAGLKQAGVDVTVTRGGTKPVGGGFMLPLRAGATAGEKYGVFRRENGRLRHLYGPSVYQLFAYQAPRISDEVADDLQQTLLDRVDEQLEKILG